MRKFFDIALYVIYTSSLYLISMVGISNTLIDNMYRIGLTIFVITAILYFKNDNSKIWSELIQSTCIPIAIQCINILFFNYKLEITVINFIISYIINIGFIMIYIKIIKFDSNQAKVDLSFLHISIWIVCCVTNLILRNVGISISTTIIVYIVGKCKINKDNKTKAL